MAETAELVLVMSTGRAARPTTESATVCPIAMVPMLNRTTLLLTDEVPWPCATFTKVRAGERVSVSTTPVATLGPKLLTDIE